MRLAYVKHIRANSVWNEILLNKTYIVFPLYGLSRYSEDSAYYGLICPVNKDYSLLFVNKDGIASFEDIVEIEYRKCIDEELP